VAGGDSYVVSNSGGLKGSERWEEGEKNNLRRTTLKHVINSI